MSDRYNPKHRRDESDDGDKPFEELSFEPGDAESDLIISDYHGVEYLEELKKFIRAEHRKHHGSLGSGDPGFIHDGFSTYGEVAYSQALHYARNKLGSYPLPQNLEELSEQQDFPDLDLTDEDYEQF